MGDWSLEKVSGGECAANPAIVVRAEIACGWSDASTCRANGVRKFRATRLKLG